MAAGEHGPHLAAAPGPVGVGSGFGPEAATTQRE